mgnify:CR=1 FL=1
MTAGTDPGLPSTLIFCYDKQAFVCSGTPNTPTATDACDGTINGTTTAVFPITTSGESTIVWTYTDNDGNSLLW